MLHNESSYGVPPNQNIWQDPHLQNDTGCFWKSSQVEDVIQVQQELKIHTNDLVNCVDDPIIYNNNLKNTCEQSKK